MKMYGSVVNRLEEHSLSPVPTVGDGATLYMYTDRLAGTVTDVKVSASGKTVVVTVTEDDYKTSYPDGYGKNYTPNPNGRKFVVKRKRNGLYVSAGMGVTFGDRRAYRDPSF